MSDKEKRLAGYEAFLLLFVDRPDLLPFAVEYASQPCITIVMSSSCGTSTGSGCVISIAAHNWAILYHREAVQSSKKSRSVNILKNNHEKRDSTFLYQAIVSAWTMQI